MSIDESNRLSQIKDKLERRSKILAGIRAFLGCEGFIEIETPLRVPAIAPEQFINPYMSEGWFLSTSPELQMKRLISAGYENIFQICHCFRKDERGRYHNPEFTMLEWYRAHANYEIIIQDTERLVLDLSNRLGSGPIIIFQGQKIDLTLPWPRITVREAFFLWAGWDPTVDYNGLKFDEDLVDKVIPNFPIGRPTILLDYPAECASLARLKNNNLHVGERAEIFIGGLEIANAYSELNDVSEQEKRFKLEMEQMKMSGQPATWPKKFLESLKYLPECTGIAVGVDRLVMLLCDTKSIDDVIAFPSDML
jgi:elongation factor P--(R)-beta-lysine ligase